MGKILLHDCCAPCGAYVLDQLLKTGYTVTVFFYNPNIFPQEEYDWRKAEMKRYCAKRKVDFIDDDYDHQDWVDHVKHLASEPERGERCRLCFAIRLSEAAQKASELGIENFATTLSISPWKSTEMINEVGREVASIYGIEFLENDWKEDDGFKKACLLSKQENFRRQNYCGCEYSIKK